jgi:hypothetical protein
MRRIISRFCLCWTSLDSDDVLQDNQAKASTDTGSMELTMQNNTANPAVYFIVHVSQYGLREIC